MRRQIVIQNGWVRESKSERSKRVTVVECGWVLFVHLLPYYPFVDTFQRITRTFMQTYREMRSDRARVLVCISYGRVCFFIRISLVKQHEILHAWCDIIWAAFMRLNYEYMENARIGCDCMLENVFNVFQLKRRPVWYFHKISKSLPPLRMVTAQVPLRALFAVYACCCCFQFEVNARNFVSVFFSCSLSAHEIVAYEGIFQGLFYKY